MSEESIKISDLNKRKNTLANTLSNLEREVADLQKKKNDLLDEIVKDRNDFKAKVFGKNKLENTSEDASIFDDIKDSQGRVNDFYNELFASENDGESKEDKINSLLKDMEEKSQKFVELEVDDFLKTAKDLKPKFDAFYAKIDEREKSIKSQNDAIAKEQSLLSSLNEQSAELLAELTDKSLHNAFRNEANNNKWAHYIFVALSLLILFGGIFLLIYSLNVQKDGASRLQSYEFWLIRFFVSVPLGFAYWLTSHSASIRLKLAQEYQHKASITEALSGYRKMWDLSHSDDEYQKLFNLVSEDLVNNPADKIKFSYGDVSQAVKDVASGVVGVVDSLTKK
jgi:hypothetical protein